MKRQLATWAVKSAPGGWSVRNVQALQARLAEDGSTLIGEGWDAATQLYLALAALQQAQETLSGNRHAAAIRAELDAIRRQLEFPQQHNSPRGFSPGHMEEIRHRIDRVRRLLDSPEGTP